MKKMMALAVLAMAVAALAVPASATGDFTATGTVLVGNPGTRVIGGVTEVVSPCNGSFDPDVPEGAANGVDGYWFAIPEDVRGRAATLTAAEPNDVDAWFYDESCALIKPAQDPNAYSMASLDQAPDGNESGTIPAAAAYAVVDLYVGAAADFTFSAPAV